MNKDKNDFSFCPQCGKQIVKGAKFCWSCGNKMVGVMDDQGTKKVLDDCYKPHERGTTNMNPAVEKLLEEARNEEQAKQHAERERVLLEMGLYIENKEYFCKTNCDQVTAQINGFHSYEHVDGQRRFFRIERELLDLTDDEYSAVYALVKGNCNT